MRELRLQTVSLQKVLDDREKRAEIQAELRTLHKAPVISITVNMPGNVKYSEDTVSLVYMAMDKVRAHIGRTRLRVMEERVCHAAAGPSAFMAVQGDANGIKELAVLIEEEAAHSRLLDIDVFDSAGRQISRTVLGLPERKCFVCSEPAVACRRGKRHAADDLFAAVGKLLTSHRAAMVNTWPREVEIIGSTALEAILLEAACSPAPGLVDRFNSGAHDDMDIFTFIQSSSALAPAMYRFALAAWNHAGPREALLPVLRCIGAAAERDMFAATKGVNTQKGLLFLMGVIVAATALAVRSAPAGAGVGAVLAMAGEICRGIVQRELGVLEDRPPGRPLTNGEKLYLSCGITGIRGEIERGFPAVVKAGLPSLREALARGLSLNDALIHALLALMAETEDTTILNRHNSFVLQSVQLDALAVMARGGMFTAAGRESIAKLDEAYIERNISPGGSADLLAVT